MGTDAHLYRTRSSRVPFPRGAATQEAGTQSLPRH